MQSTPGGPDKDFKYVLHWVDHCSNLAQLRAIKTKSAENVRDCLLELFTTFGAPDILQSDNGSEFRNEIVDALCAEFGIDRVYGRPYYPQSNGGVERVNRTAKTKLASWIYGRVAEQDWTPGLWRVQLQMNSAHKRGLKSSAYQLVFNRSPNVEAGRAARVVDGSKFLQLMPEEENDEPMHDDENAADLTAEHEERHEAAAAASAAYQSDFVERHNAGAGIKRFELGALVTLKLRKKTVSALQLPRQVFMVVKMSREPNTCRLYCKYGVLKDPVPFNDLEPVLEANREPDLNWDVQEITARWREHHVSGTLNEFVLTQAELMRRFANNTPVEAEDLTSVQKMKKKEAARRAKKKRKAQEELEAAAAAADAAAAAPPAKKQKQKAAVPKQALTKSSKASSKPKINVQRVLSQAKKKTLGARKSKK
jgi:hypothetical protein